MCVDGNGTAGGLLSMWPCYVRRVLNIDCIDYSNDDTEKALSAVSDVLNCRNIQ